MAVPETDVTVPLPLLSSAACNPLVLAMLKAASAIAVVLPDEVTTPVRFAFVVTVDALPVKAPTNVSEVTEVSPVMVAGKLNTGVAPPVDAI